MSVFRDENLMRLLITFPSRVLTGSSIVTGATASCAANNHNINRTLSLTSPLNSYHNSLCKLKNGERMILFRNNNSLKRSFKKVNNESSLYSYQYPHDCTIELKTKASSCLHLFNKTPPLTLTTFRNQSDQSDGDDQKKNNEILWRYQYDISKTKTSHSQCNLNNVQHNYNQVTNNSNNMIMTETKFNNSLENKTIF